MGERPKILRTVDDLRQADLIGDAEVQRLQAIAGRYAIAVTPALAALIDRSRADDPIARQFVPDVRELDERAEDRADPIGDKVHEKVPGVVHRYPDRALLKLTHTCPVYCRFCFRREMVGPGGSGALDSEALERALAYVASQPGLREIILTGGDPFVLSPRRIADVTQRLSGIGHLQILRWHTRVPIADPARVTGELVRALRSDTKAVYVGIHANHPRELTSAARDACRRLADEGMSLVSQTVLLKGVNDNADTLEQLFRTFLTLGIRPYYLHHADLAPGTAHFRTTVTEGQALMRQLRGRVSGLALPTYVLDVPGGYGKVPVGPAYIDESGRVTDVGGVRHDYHFNGPHETDRLSESDG